MTKKYQKTDKSLILACVFFLGTLVFGILALCFCANDATVWNFPLWSVFAVCFAAFLIAYVAVLIYASVKEHDFKRIFELSLEISVVAVLLLSLLPVAAILWLVERLIDAIVDKNSSK